MSGPRTSIWIMTGINVLAAIVTLVCCAYIFGLKDGASTEVSNAAINQRPAGVIRNPGSGAGRHPAMDCSRMAEALPPAEKGVSNITDLAKKPKSFEGRSVVVQGRVVQAFGQIMGTNWFSLCEKPGGDVLVVSAPEWVEVGHDVVVRGTLSVDRNIGNAYLFPLFIENAALEGPTVKPSDNGKPSSIFYL